MSETAAPPVSELAKVTADLNTIRDVSQAGIVAKKAQLHAMVTALKADIVAAEKALGDFTPAADINAGVVWVEKEVQQVASEVKSGAIKWWHPIASLAVGGAAMAAVLFIWHLF